MNLDSMFAAAREDGPTDDRKKAAWDEIAAATGAASVGVAAKSTMSAKLLASKIGLLSALVIAAGGAATFASTDSSDVRAAAGVTREPPARASIQSARILETVTRTQVSEVEPAARVVAPGSVTTATTTATATDEEGGSLAEETRLLTSARAALVRGDAAGAMALLQQTKKLRSRALEPEELGLEARIAKALGRVDDAEAAELRLKSVYPNHALAH